MPDKDNNFRSLRYLAATCVVFQHSFNLLGIVTIPTGWIGLEAFFVISGYLVAQSYARDPSLTFFKKRIFRIVPAFIAATLFTAFIIGPLVTTLNLGDYLSNPQALLYPLNAFGHDWLPGVFENNPFPNAVNGSLWSLPIEFLMYIVLFGIGMMGLMKKNWLVLIYLATLAFVLATNRGFMGIDPYPHFIFFSAGMALTQIQTNNRQALFAAGALAISLATPYSIPVMCLTFPYLVIWLSTLKIDFLRVLNGAGDYSYGLYVFAFPIQQTIVHALKPEQPLVLFALTMLIALPIAIVSWHALEKPALNLLKRPNAA